MEHTDVRVKRGWVFYDWANSAYTLVVGTAVYPIYYGAVMESAEVSSFDLPLLGAISHTAAYTFAIAAAYLTISILAPYLAALAEVAGNKRSYMRSFVYLGVTACASMFLFTPDRLWLGLLAPYVASLSFAGSLVFYNSYLPEIAAPEEQDALSARGFAMGYFGSSFLLIAVLVAVQNPGWFGSLATVGLVTRWSFVLVALWWVGFGEYALVRLPRGAAHLEGEKTPPPRPSSTYKALYTAVAELLTDRALRRFVLAFFFASAGVQTVILIASLFGSQVLGLSTSSLIVTILMIQYVAMAGAWSFARISKRWGNMATLILGVCGWIAVCVGAYFVQNEGQFYALGAAVGLVMGGLQSLTRSTYAKMLPEAEDHVTYFSFYDIAEKLATVLGMVSVGWLETVTGNLRLSALLLVGYFLVALYFWVRIRRYTFNPHTASQA